ncbi:MAG: glycyl-radical enzyme activating protein [Desulfitobacteriaceae bacterium]|nr:glycyl-radical enzyme activating protein [Desulfitobacteriaceae bacterium]
MSSKEIQGSIFDIMRYAIHDGPGIRTTVFFKGCPLHCWWCHNPESQRVQQEIIIRPERCHSCGDCRKACLNNAINHKENCTSCGRCAKACLFNARELVGRTVSVGEAIKEIEKDIIFFDQSGGGATFSGGEPLMQPAFLQALLESCREKEIHTVVETCGFARHDLINKIKDSVNLFLYDIKILDSKEHEKYTGVNNKLILENLKNLAGSHRNVVVRIPVIPGINDSRDCIMAIGHFVSSLITINEIHLLPYHKAGAGKYPLAGRTYILSDLEPPGEEKMLDLKNILEQLGFKTQIGG